MSSYLLTATNHRTMNSFHKQTYNFKAKDDDDAMRLASEYILIVSLGSDVWRKGKIVLQDESGKVINVMEEKE